MLDTIAGLPAHPLIVHLPVVALPLAALGLVVLVLRPAWRNRFATAVLILLGLGALGALAALISGNAFAQRVGRPEAHADAGLALVIGACALLAGGGAWLLWVRRGEPSRAQSALGWVVAAAGLVVIGLTIRVGHTGATAVWGAAIAGPGAVTSATSPTPTPSSASAPPAEGSTPTSSASTDSSATGYTMTEVAQHASADNCWAVIDEKVYDLTEWIDAHPGGSDRILALCGTDATSQFTAQHAGDERPADELAAFELGPLHG